MTIQMKKLFLATVVSAMTWSINAALPQPDLLVQIHFAGGTTVAADQNYEAVKSEFSSPEALALRKQTADKLAKFFANWFGRISGNPNPAGATALRPLLEDLQQNEWWLDARDSSGKAEAVLALKAAPGRAAIWQSALKPYFPKAIFENAGGWIVFRSGPAAPAVPSKIPSLNGAWLAVDINWPALGNFSPAVRELDLPETRFSFGTGTSGAQVNGTFLFPEHITAVKDPWRVPTNSLRAPFASFTAVRGFAGWLEKQSWGADWRINPTPNELFVWALPNFPFQTFAAVPRANSLDALQQLHARLEPLVATIAAKNEAQFPINLELTNRTLHLFGLPFVAPYFEAVKGTAGEFLFAGAFPNTPKSIQPIPGELFKRFEPKDLMFYHWEITSNRMETLNQIAQFTMMASWHQQLDGESAGFKWVHSVTPKLGSTLTQVFQTGPQEMTFSRTAPGFFTAFEFYALASWLEAQNFPGCNLKMPPRKAFPKRAKPATPGN